MSVPQMPTWWTRTSASPGPGAAGPGMSSCFQTLGDSRERAFMGGSLGRVNHRGTEYTEEDGIEIG